MRPIGARGFTLVEMLLGCALVGILGGMVTVVVTGAARMSARAVARLGAARTLFSLDELLRQELRDAADSELVASGESQLLLRRAIGEALLCAASRNAITLPRADWSGTRTPEAGRDEALLLLDADSATWQLAGITQVVADRCPADAAPAWRVEFDVMVPDAHMMRVMEPVRLSAYRSGAADWLGLAPADGSSAVQPFAGPLDPGDARFVTRPGMLDARIRPRGSAEAVFQVPLGSKP